MAIADIKKVQTFINVAAQAAQDLDAIATKLEHLRTLWTSHNIDPTGTALDGNVAAVSTWIDAVRAVADSAVPNGLVQHIVPSHRSMAFGQVV